MVFAGNGNGTFSSGIDFPTGTQPGDVIVADLNHDGSPDLVVANYGNNTISILLNLAGTHLQLKSSLNPSNPGQAVTFAATVRGSMTKSPVPTGSIVFNDGSKTLGRVSLSQGIASFTTSALSKGSHRISAIYSGDGQFNPNNSAVLNQVVK